MTTKETNWAAFWCGILHPVLHEDLGGGERSRLLREIAEKTHRTPDKEVRKFSVATLRRMLRRFRKESLDGLTRRQRSDRGSLRVAPSEVLTQLIELKKELPTRSADTLARMIQTRTGVTLARATIYRHLKAAGATRLKLGVTKEPVRCRWTRDHSHDLWVGDFEEGPVILTPSGETVRAHLSAFIDCHSRFVVSGRYYLRQNLPILEDTLLRAFAVHGKPLELYVDNAKVYHSDGIRLLCAKLEIRLRHRKPGDPPGGGLIERVIQTAQNQFETEVRAGKIMSLDELNEAFGAWLELVYHARKHSETEQTPAERLARGRGVTRAVDLSEIHAFFFRRDFRTVDRTFSDVQVDNHFYRVDARLRGDRIEVRTDPFGVGTQALLFSLDGHPLGEGRLHQREEGEAARPIPTGASPRSSFAEDLRADLRRRLREDTSGIDFRKLTAPGRWPFNSFATLIARELHRQGDLSAFNGAELEALKLFWDAHPGVSPDLVRQAVRADRQAPLLQILHAIQSLQF